MRDSGKVSTEVGHIENSSHSDKGEMRQALKTSELMGIGNETIGAFFPPEPRFCVAIAMPSHSSRVLQINSRSPPASPVSFSIGRSLSATTSFHCLHAVRPTCGVRPRNREQTMPRFTADVEGMRVGYGYYAALRRPPLLGWLVGTGN